MSSVPGGVSSWQTSRLQHLVYDRELGYSQRYRHSLRSLYGNSSLVAELDIVNELRGHGGCVNALSWSKSGRLLASGSDDTHVNIHNYQPDDSNDQFSLATTIDTGHRANIFSVKFMPHSNDRIVISAAGDREVRIFDLQHNTGSSITADHPSAPVTRRGAQSAGLYSSSVRYLSVSSTNCKVYRSHRERVKRIVTESSPHLFLTCSEDGDVRQWDLRQPSSAYPRPTSSTSDDFPPPLISYSRFGLDLNSITCSPSQPHYIALGGAHLHCLLHDRRYLGRNRASEAGQPGFNTNLDDMAPDALTTATRCVRKFAPNGKQRMHRNDSGHITACKISDANPNEMVVSWSGDGIYSFDLIRSPDASELAERRRSSTKSLTQSEADGLMEKKRKRHGMSMSSIPEATTRAEPRPKTESSTAPSPDEHDMALRVHFANGQTEEIPLQSLTDDGWTSHQRSVRDMARRVGRLRSALFEPRTLTEHSEREDPTGHAAVFTSILGLCSVTLSEMKRVHADWAYPVESSPAEVATQRELRSHRDTCIRFVQAAGVLARLLGGKLHTASAAPPDMSQFERVQVLSTEGPDLSTSEQFHIDFLRAIFLWLDSGVGSLLQGFSPEHAPNGKIRRFPVPVDADMDAIDEVLAPYLLQRASSEAVPKVDASRFELDENQILFDTEHDAVREFADAVRIPFADLSATEAGRIDDDAQDRTAAIRFWAMQVARGILKTMAEPIKFSFITKAFGGSDHEDVASVDAAARRTTDQHMNGRGFELDSADEDEEESDDDNDDDNDDLDDDDEDEEEDDDAGDTSSEEDEDDDDQDEDLGFLRRGYGFAARRRNARALVEADIECGTHTRVYRGHCNVQTVKDVNFYGLNNEYVVSGSDDGNLFIWDRKTTKLVNILEGDGEVVNVIQGHPYEPMLAVSGIDDTIKIFSPDSRARLAARLGSGVVAADPTTFSSINWPSRSIGRRMRRASAAAQTADSGPAADRENTADAIDPIEDELYVRDGGLESRKRLDQEYQITSSNDSRTQASETAVSFTMQDILEMFLLRR